MSSSGWRRLVRCGLVLSALGVCQVGAAPALLPVLIRSPGQETPMLLGAWQSGVWLQPGAALARRLRGQERYRRQTLSGPSATVPTVTVRGGRAVSLGVPCKDAYHVSTTPASTAPAFEVFTSSPQNVRPRPVTSLPTNMTAYREIVRRELVRRGLPTPRVNLTALIRADLDGNGTQEVIIEASRFAGRPGEFPPPVGGPGDYSLLLLRHVVAGQVRTVVLGEHLAPLRPWNPDSTEPMPMASLFRLAGVADLNADGRMELLTYSAYYEGHAFAAQEWTPAGGLKVRLESGCGV